MGPTWPADLAAAAGAAERHCHRDARPVGTGRYIDVVAFFVLTMAHGTSWDDSLPIRQQRAWDDHAAFMDSLVEEGFVVLGGPLGDGRRALLVIEASDESMIEPRLREDPWASMDLLRIGSIEPWTIWLDGTHRLSRSG